MWFLLVVTLVGSTPPVSMVERFPFKSQASCDAARRALDAVTQVQSTGWIQARAGTSTAPAGSPAAAAAARAPAAGQPAPFFSREARCVAE
jgi:hypothetical protein